MQNMLRRVSFARRLTDHEQALDKGACAKGAAYIKIEDKEHEDYWGAGIDPNIDVASFKAVLCALNRAAQAEGGQE
ncbi:MAG: hypothetical protein M0Z61_07875 [Nitrospiraceae bacterium]|nr:hypothetical protein [Nitrospiraceae bacterium]